MIQRWSKTRDASNNIVWKKTTVSTSQVATRFDSSLNANKVLVTNPEVTSSPDDLNNILGKMKGNINELYGNVKWLSLHGGGGTGTGGGGTTPAVTTTTQIKLYGAYNGNDDYDLTTNNITSISLNDDSYQVKIRLLNAVTGTDYKLVVKKNKKQILTQTLNRSNNSAYVNITELSTDKYANLTFTITDSDGYSDYDSPSLTLNYASISLNAYLYVMNYLPKACPITSSQSAMQRDVNSGYKVYFYFTPTADGTVRWKLNTNIQTVDKEDYSLSGEITNVEANVETLISGNYIELKNTDTESNFGIGQFFTASMSVTLYDMVGNAMCTETVSFSPSIIPDGDFFIVPSNSYWNNTSVEGYSDSYFQNGNNINLELIIGGDETKYPSLYLIPKIYYGSANDEAWYEINDAAVQYGGVTPEETENNYFPNSNYDPEKKYQFLTENSTQIALWKTYNKDRLVSGIESTGVRTTITIPYSIITSEMFANTNANSQKAFADIKIDFYVVAIDDTIKDNDYLILPLDENGNYSLSSYSFKTQVERSTFSVPNYVTGIEKGVRHSGNYYTYSANKSLYFNLDTINYTSLVSGKENSFNALVDASYNNKVAVETGSKLIPMRLNGSNGITSGLIKDDNGYYTFRTSGGAYGYISAEDFNTQFLNKSSRNFTGLSDGFTYEICFKSDEHPTKDGTIFSLGDYSYDGALSLGVSIDLEEAKFIVTNTTTSETATISVELSQNTFYQLDFVYELTSMSGGVRNDTAIIKIYKNGIPTAVSSLAISNTSVSSLPKYNISFGDTETDMCFGCRSTSTESLRNYCDVDFYGIRLYSESLTEQEIIKNWMISKAYINQKTLQTQSGDDYKELDWENVINPMLKNNYYDSSWVCSLWDYTTVTNTKPQVADGETLLNQMGDDGWKYDELSKSYYRPLPVVYLKAESKTNVDADQFYGSYNESDAALNNKRIDNEDWTNIFQGSFHYYDTNYQQEITDDNITVGWYMQGTSTQQYRSKNIEVVFIPTDNTLISGDLDVTNDNKPLFTPKPSSWLPENRFTLKADMVDSAHANNAAIGSWINSSGFMPKNAAQQDTTNPYRNMVKETLEGFPCLVFVDWGDKTKAGTDSHNGVEFLGIYSFNLGRGSFYNLGFRKFKSYELTGNSNLSSNATIDNMRDVEFADPNECTHASFVRRYHAYDANENPNIYSFECTTNEPDDAVGFGQPNPDLLNTVWDLKYTSGEESVGRARLNEIVKNLSYINSDSLNFWEEVSRPKYYYGIHSDGTYNFPLYVFRNPEDPTDFTLEDSIDLNNPNSDGTYNVKTGGAATPKGVTKNLKKDYMSWYEGLKNLHGEDGIVFNKNGEAISGLPDQTSDYKSFDAKSSTAWKLGYTDNAEGGYKPILDSAPLLTNNIAEAQWIHYGSFSRYFIIAMIFGMVDSLGKNLTLRSWNIKDKDTGTIVPAFYDMDTALGLDNGGSESVDPTVYVDYWINNNTLSTSNDSAMPLNVITEDTPYVDTTTTVDFDFYGDGTTVSCYNWYDRTDDAAASAGKTKTLIGRYPKNGDTLPMPSTVRYNLNNSHLWHLIRFMPSINYVGGELNAWAPLGQYGLLRGSSSYQFQDVDTFYNNYYLKHNENVGEFIFALDYKEKYMHAYEQAGTTGGVKYNDLIFCHGRRDDYVKKWLNKRINFLDTVYNLRKFYQKGVGSLQMGPESAWISSDSYFNTEYAAKSSTTPYLEDTLTNSTKINGSGSGVIRGYVTSNTTTALIINITNTQYRFFLRADVPTKVYFTEPTSPISVHINNISTLTTWTNFKNLRLTEMNANWKFLEVDLSNQNSLRASSDAFNLNQMTDLKECNLQNFQTETTGETLDLVLTNLVKLETLNISDSCFKTLSLPSGGNLKTLILRNTKLTGEVKLDNLMNLEGNVDFTNVPGITKITINNCPKLSSITLSGNTSLEEIVIKNCPGLTAFSYAGLIGDEDVKTSKVTNISITDDCSGIRSITVTNIPNEDLVMNFSGATGLRNLSLSSITSSNMPILPDYYVDTTSEEKRTDYEIYNSSTSSSISLNDINFSGFKFGANNDRGIVSYVPASDGASYPSVALHKSTETSIENVILNLAPFGKLGYLSVTRCSNIKYIACPPTTVVSSMNLNSLSSLERIFGYMPMYIDESPVFGYKSLGNFRICDWNNTDVTKLMVKQKFEEVIDNPTSEKISEFIELMHDSYEGQQPVQGVIPTTRLSLKTGTTSLEQAFYGTSVGTNDFYYIMMLVNIYNKDAKTIKNLTKMFQGCSKISTSYSSKEDLSPSRYIFKWLHTVEIVQNMFTGCSDMKGVIYSPDYSIGNEGTLDGTSIGTLTPLVMSATSFNNIGWSLNIYDDYTFWTPTGTPTYYDENVDWTGVCSNIYDVNGVYNNVSCITCATYGDKFDKNNTYFKLDVILKSFSNATSITNSFNYISVDFTSSNVTRYMDGKAYTYSTIFKGMSHLQKIYNSFNARLAMNTIAVDIFAGNPYSLKNEANDYPNNITNIEGSFGFSCSSKYAYFCLTDDMFQRIKNSIQTISPSVGAYSLSNSNNGTFYGTNIIKTYVKFNSDGTTSDAKFPYGVFRGCSALTDAPSFFSDIDLRYYVDAIQFYDEWDSGKYPNFFLFDNTYAMSVEPNQKEYLLDVPIPDYYSSKPYTRVSTLDGTVKHSPDIEMFKDCSSLKNISAMFNRLVPPRMKFKSTSLEDMYIPGGFVLVSEGLKGLTNLQKVEYLFADNHYFRGQIPYALLSTGYNPSATKVSVSGTDSFSAAFAGVSGCSDTTSDFIQLRYKMDSNDIVKGSAGIYDVANNTDGYVYIPAPDEINDPWIIKETDGEIETYSYNGVLYPQFRQCDLTNVDDLKKTRYKRISKASLPWYQTYDYTNSSSVVTSSAVEDVSMYSQNITDMSYLFYKNDSAGYLPLRYSKDFDSYTNIYANPIADDSDYLRRAKLYKWNAYSDNDYVHVSDASYNNSNLLCVNKLYNRFKFVPNPLRNLNKNCIYENISTKDGTVIYFINGSYDPRLYVANHDTNKVTINEFVFDGVQLSDAEKTKLINAVKPTILASDVNLKSIDNYGIGRYSAETLNSFIESKIPTKWFDSRKYVSKSIYYATGENDTEKTISDTSLNDIGDNEYNLILKMKGDENYFCPSDIFNYVNSGTANIKFSFAYTAYQPTKCGVTKYRNFVYDNDNVVSNQLRENIQNGTIETNGVGYYLEGNPYTGIEGRVSPMLFDDASLFQNIEGIFTGNPQLSPYYYAGTVSSESEGNIQVSGELFDYRTFENLSSLKSAYLLWANNIVPRQVNLNKETFKSNINLQYLDYMFAGTLWFNTATDDSAYGTQIPEGLFDGLKYIRSARATFSSPINFNYSTDESATISCVSNITGGEPRTAGTLGEYSGGNIGIGTYGVRWIPDDLFNDSSTTIEMISNMCFFDQNLTNFPDIYQYDNFKDKDSANWDKKLYHTAYYLSGKLDSKDKKAMGSEGWWNLNTPTQLRDNGNKVYYESASFNSNLV